MTGSCGFFFVPPVAHVRRPPKRPPLPPPPPLRAAAPAPVTAAEAGDRGGEDGGVRRPRFSLRLWQSQVADQDAFRVKYCTPITTNNGFSIQIFLSPSSACAKAYQVGRVGHLICHIGQEM